MALLEKEDTRFAESLDDYELLRVSHIGGTEESGYWLTVRDDRFGLEYEIASHADYWDFLGYFLNHMQYPAKPVTKEVA
jgi:hypothetical protein